jgi:uncharacterized coiled-coil protein SlyX
LPIKHDALLKEWMDREKAAVDYGRKCDKRIAELEAQIAVQIAVWGKRLDGAPSPPVSTGKIEVPPQLDGLARMVTALTSEIDQLRAQLSEAIAMYQTHSETGSTAKNRLLKLEALADMAQLGLAEELRILKTNEPAVEDLILVTDGEDQIPPRWLPLKRALQALYNTGVADTRKAKTGQLGN